MKMLKRLYIDLRIMLGAHFYLPMGFITLALFTMYMKKMNGTAISDQFVYHFLAITFSLWGIILFANITHVEKSEGSLEIFATLPNHRALTLMSRSVAILLIFILLTMGIGVFIHLYIAPIKWYLLILNIMRPTLYLSTLSLMAAVLCGDYLVGMIMGFVYFSSEIWAKWKFSKILYIYGGSINDYPYSVRTNSIYLFLLSMVFLMISLLMYNSSYFLKSNRSK